MTRARLLCAPLGLLLALALALAGRAAGGAAETLGSWWAGRYDAGIRSVTAVDSRVEIELYSTREPRIGAMLNWLRIGHLDLLEWAPGEYDSRLGTRTYTAILTAEDFAALPDRAPVAFMYGSPASWAYREIDFGRLDKRMLRAGLSGLPPTPAPRSPARATAPRPE